MAVAFDAKMTAGDSSDGDCLQGNNVQLKSGTGITVGGSATLLVVPIGLQNTASFSTVPTARNVTWNGVSMTESAFVSSFDASAVHVHAGVYTLVSPTTGAQELEASWQSAGCDIYMGAVSFTGTDTTTGIQTGDSTTATQTTQITVTSSTNGATVALLIRNGGLPTGFAGTKIWDDEPYAPGGGADYMIGGTSNVHSYTGGSAGTRQALAGVHVIAGEASAPQTPFQPYYQLAPILAQ